MISKELLGCILCKNVLSFNIKGNEILIQFDNHDDILNIYELSHKCKEWANKNSYYVASGKYYENWDCEIFEISWDAKSWHEPEETFDAPTEPEAIFKACQWILDNIKES